MIADRLDFLRGLELLLFDPDHRKTIKERSQLHKIVANETWIFGEEFALVVSDQSLTEALKQHIGLLGRDYVALDEDEPAEREVLDAEGKRRIVDLMLARAMEQRRNRREHLVVELKAPAVKLGSKELIQIEKYAFTVASDARFNTIDVEWDFIVVSDQLDDYAERRTNQSGQPRGLIYRSEDEKVRVWARPWAEIIQDAKHRLKFVEEKLQYAATAEHAVEYLRGRHAAFLPESMPDPDAAPLVTGASVEDDTRAEERVAAEPDGADSSSPDNR